MVIHGNHFLDCWESDFIQLISLNWCDSVLITIKMISRKLIRCLQLTLIVFGICNIIDSSLRVYEYLSGQFNRTAIYTFYRAFNKLLQGSILIFGLRWDQLIRCVDLIETMNFEHLFPNQTKTGHSKIIKFNLLMAFPVLVSLIATICIDFNPFRDSQFIKSTSYMIRFFLLPANIMKMFTIQSILIYLSINLGNYFDIINRKIIDFSRSVNRDNFHLNQIRCLYSSNIRATQAAENFAVYIVASIYFECICLNPIIFHRYFIDSSGSLISSKFFYYMIKVVIMILMTYLFVSLNCQAYKSLEDLHKISLCRDIDQEEVTKLISPKQLIIILIKFISPLI